MTEKEFQAYKEAIYKERKRRYEEAKRKRKNAEQRELPNRAS